MKKGYVYILSNPCMEGIYKIGYSEYGGTARADILYRNDTAVPLPFVIEYEAYTVNFRPIERQIHIQLNDFRVNPNREFFRLPLKLAIATIEKLTPVDVAGITVKKRRKKPVYKSQITKNEWQRVVKDAGFSEQAVMYLRDCEFVSATNNMLVVETKNHSDDCVEFSIIETLNEFLNTFFTLHILRIVEGDI